MFNVIISEFRHSLALAAYSTAFISKFLLVNVNCCGPQFIFEGQCLIHSLHKMTGDELSFTQHYEQ